MRATLVDCYDSFTWNLVQVLATLGVDVDVVACDRTSVEELSTSEAIVLGPGPGRPEDAGVLVDAVRALGGRVPILGVCLGHQAIAVALGGAVVRHRPVHGYTSLVTHDGTGLFAGLPSPLEQMRYHSLAAVALPDGLRACAWSEDGAIQALVHRSWPMWGVQFHPESVGSGEAGTAILGRFVALAAATLAARDRAGPARPPTERRARPSRS